MTSKNQLKVILQTGPFTPPDLLVRDFRVINSTKLNVQRLATEFRSGGIATFITVETDNANVDGLAKAICRHTKRLSPKGGDDVIALIGGEIDTTEEEVAFRNVKSRRHVSLKEKNEDEIKEILLEADLG